MITSGFFVALIGIAALAAGLGAWLGLSLVWQCAVFVTFSGVLLAGIRPTAKTWFYRLSDPTPTNLHALIGKSGIVTEPSAGPSSPARVKVGSEEWRAIAADQRELPCGAHVTVTEVNGSTLTVQAS